MTDVSPAAAIAPEQQQQVPAAVARSPNNRPLRRSRRIIRVRRAVAANPAAATATANIPPVHYHSFHPDYHVPIKDLRPKLVPEMQPAANNEGKLEPFRIVNSNLFTQNTTTSVFGESFPQHVPLNAHDSDALECVICYDFMKDPVGCGKFACGARFCRSCLEQALGGSTANDNNNNVEKRCPVCRSLDVCSTPDWVLTNKMKKDVFVACPNCSESPIPLGQLDNHKTNFCSAIHVACRLAFYGCKWTGRRGERHERTCPLEPIAETFLERFRTEYINQQNNTQQILTQLNGLRSLTMSNMQPQTAMDPRNPVHVLSYCFVTMLRRREGSTPGTTGDAATWNRMLNCTIARKTVQQTLVLIPTWIVLAVALRSALSSIDQIPTLGQFMKLLHITVTLIVFFVWFCPGRFVTETANSTVVHMFVPFHVTAETRDLAGALSLGFLFYDILSRSSIPVIHLASLCFASILLPSAVFRAGVPDEVSQQQAVLLQNEVNRNISLRLVIAGLHFGVAASLFVSSTGWLKFFLIFMGGQLTSNKSNLRFIVDADAIFGSIFQKIRYLRLCIMLCLYVVVCIEGVTEWKLPLPECKPAWNSLWTDMMLIQTVIGILTSSTRGLLILAGRLGKHQRMGRTGTVYDNLGVLALLGWGVALLSLTTV